MHITSFAPDRQQELFALLRTCLGERETTRRDERFWQWKHESNPFGSSIVLLGEEADELVGLRAFLRWQWQTRLGEVVRAVRAVDTVTHPAHQRKGIFSQLTRAGLEQARADQQSFVFNTPNQNSMPGYLKMGWQHVASLPMQVRLLHPLRFAVAISRQKLFRKSAANFKNQVEIHGEPLRMERFLETVSGLEQLIQRDAALRGDGYTTSRSLAFLAWRYSSHPYVPYYVEAVRNNERVRAAMIWRTNERFGLREVMVSDLLLDSGDPALVRQLLRGVCRRVRADYLIAHFPVDSRHRALLGRSGFFDLPGQRMNFTVRPLNEAVTPDPLQARNWSLCLGDLEIF